MNSKMIKTTVGVVTGVTLTLSACEGVKQVRENIDNLNVEIQQLKSDINKKEEEISKLQDSLEKKDLDLNYFAEERKLLYNEIENLKNKITNSKVKFNSSNLKQTSGVDVERLNKALEGTELHGLGSAYVNAEKQYGINALFLTALTAQESGWGTSNRARTQNNLSGYAVYSNSSKGRSFNSKTSSIMETARLISDDYLNSKGKYYKGKDIFSVNETYCPDDDFHWANNINSIAKELMQEINSL